jgi:hypothetical protein
MPRTLSCSSKAKPPNPSTPKNAPLRENSPGPDYGRCTLQTWLSLCHTLGTFMRNFGKSAWFSNLHFAIRTEAFFETESQGLPFVVKRELRFHAALLPRCPFQLSPRPTSKNVARPKRADSWGQFQNSLQTSRPIPRSECRVVWTLKWQRQMQAN